VHINIWFDCRTVPPFTGCIRLQVEEQKRRDRGRFVGLRSLVGNGVLSYALGVDMMRRMTRVLMNVFIVYLQAAHTVVSLNEQ